MRFDLIDVLFMYACIIIGSIVGALLSSHLPGCPRKVAMVLGGPCLYLALVYPFYRGFRRYPMVLPRCPCCGKRPGMHRRGGSGEEKQDRDGFWICGNWPRIIYRCAQCDGEFVVWPNGKPGDQETWEKPVLALKWPYAWGIYRRVKKPNPAAAPNAGSADVLPPSTSDNR